MKIRISRKVLLAMNIFTSRDDSRFVLNGVCLEVLGKNCFVVASDGRRIAAMKHGEVIEQPEKKTRVIIRIEPAMLKAMPKSENNYNDDVVVTILEKTAQFSVLGKSGVKFESELIEGSFPTWRQVIPKGKLSSPIDPSFNWRLLEGFVKAAEIISGKSDNAIVVRQKDELSPMLIMFPSSQLFVGALMPIRIDSRDEAPDWTQEDEAPANPPEAAKTPALPPATTTAPAAA